MMGVVKEITLLKEDILPKNFAAPKTNGVNLTKIGEVRGKVNISGHRSHPSYFRKQCLSQSLIKVIVKTAPYLSVDRILNACPGDTR